MTTDPVPAGTLASLPAHHLSLATSAGEATRPRLRTRGGRVARRAFLGLQVAAALWLFLCAIAIMKDGASALAPALQGSTLTNSLASTLGFGWLGAMLVMSGSPVAVSALALLEGGAVSAEGAFTMLTGSRLGASFVVLMVAFVYATRGNQSSRARHASLSIGLFALLMTAVVYVPALAIGLPLLESGVLGSLVPASASQPPDVVQQVTGPLVNAVAGLLPDTTLFFAGLVLLLMSVRLFDRALPEASDAARLEEHTDWRSRRWVMFGVGSLVALVTMSVSVALTVLVPAVAKGYFRRRQVLPYIMGANVTTLGDTLLTAVVIGTPTGIQVVLAELLATMSITLLLLAFLYRPLTERVVQLTDWILRSRRRLGMFVAVLFCVPLLLVQAF